MYQYNSQLSSIFPISKIWKSQLGGLPKPGFCSNWAGGQKTLAGKSVFQNHLCVAPFHIPFWRFQNLVCLTYIASFQHCVGLCFRRLLTQHGRLASLIFFLETSACFGCNVSCFHLERCPAYIIQNWHRHSRSPWKKMPKVLRPKNYVPQVTLDWVSHLHPLQRTAWASAWCWEPRSGSA